MCKMSRRVKNCRKLASGRKVECDECLLPVTVKFLRVGNIYVGKSMI